MKVLALALLFSLSVPKIAPPAQKLVTETAVQHPRKGGKWYFAAQRTRGLLLRPGDVCNRSSGQPEARSNFLPERPTHGRAERLVPGFFSTSQEKTSPTSTLQNGALRFCLS